MLTVLLGTTNLTLICAPLGTEMTTLSNHTEPCFSSSRIWLANPSDNFWLCLACLWSNNSTPAHAAISNIKCQLHALPHTLLAISSIGEKLLCKWCMLCFGAVVNVVWNIVTIKWILNIQRLKQHNYVVIIDHIRGAWGKGGCFTTPFTFQCKAVKVFWNEVLRKGLEQYCLGYLFKQATVWRN